MNDDDTDTLDDLDAVFYALAVIACALLGSLGLFLLLDLINSTFP